MFVVTLTLVGRSCQELKTIGTFESWDNVVSAVQQDLVHDKMESEFVNNLDFTERVPDWNEDGIDYWDIGSDELSYIVKKI